VRSSGITPATCGERIGDHGAQLLHDVGELRGVDVQALELARVVREVVEELLAVETRSL
jgi:hypothetical protein